MMELGKIFVFLSEGETMIENDVSLLKNKKIITEADLLSEDVALVCISRDYYNLPNTTNAFRIRDQVSNVFCPPWRINSVSYHSLSGIMDLPSDVLPDIYVITANEEIYDNLDYYLHLSEFGRRYKLLLNNSQDFVPIESEIQRSDVLSLGEQTLEILHLAGYDRDVNGPLPGWIFQSANPWLTRLLDLYEVSPVINLRPPRPTTLLITKEKLKEDIENPVYYVDPHIGEDIRTCFLESFSTRKEVVYDLTKRLIEMIEKR